MTASPLPRLLSLGATIAVTAGLAVTSAVPQPRRAPPRRPLRRARRRDRARRSVTPRWPGRGLPRPTRTCRCRL